MMEQYLSTVYDARAHIVQEDSQLYITRYRHKVSFSRSLLKMTKSKGGDCDYVGFPDRPAGPAAEREYLPPKLRGGKCALLGNRRSSRMKSTSTTQDSLNILAIS